MTLLAQGSGATVVAVVGLLGTFVTALASLIGVLINNRRTSAVDAKVNGQLTAILEKWETEHEARLKAEFELAQEREQRGEH